MKVFGGDKNKDNLYDSIIFVVWYWRQQTGSWPVSESSSPGPAAPNMKIKINISINFKWKAQYKTQTWALPVRRPPPRCRGRCLVSRPSRTAASCRWCCRTSQGPTSGTRRATGSTEIRRNNTDARQVAIVQVYCVLYSTLVMISQLVVRVWARSF